LVSSGSEAEPKMVLYSHNALAGGRGGFIEALRHGREPMRNLFLVPLGSPFGSSGTPVTIARHGDTLLVLERFDADRALEMIHAHQATHVFGVPTMFQMMLASERLAQVDTSSLRALVTGGAAIDAKTVQACRERFGCPVVNVYGSGDGVNCHTALDEAPERVATIVGRPNPAVAAIRIVDEQGRDVDAGVEGEIWARGPMSPMCYVNAPELDARYRTPDGWVRTGDRGVLDPDGYLRVLGRSTEIIIRGGHNISPTEIEQLLQEHPAILHAACVGVPDQRLGERVCACVVLREGAPRPSLEELSAFLVCEHGLERAKLPERLVILPELPLSPAGKIAKRAMRELLAASEAKCP
jgi:acyl-CoA synthetase (AMP-forming)/AMP-acid ligase II